MEVIRCSTLCQLTGRGLQGQGTYPSPSEKNHAEINSERGTLNKCKYFLRSGYPTKDCKLDFKQALGVHRSDSSRAISEGAIVGLLLNRVISFHLNTTTFPWKKEHWLFISYFFACLLACLLLSYQEVIHPGNPLLCLIQRLFSFSWDAKACRTSRKSHFLFLTQNGVQKLWVIDHAFWFYKNL